MFGLIKTWKALEAKGIMGINRRNADYVLKYNKRRLYPVVDDKIITKMRAIEAGIHVPEMYGIISTEKEIEKLDEIIGGRTDFVIKPAQGAGGDGILVIADRFEGRYRTVSGKIISHEEIEHQISSILTGLHSLGGHRAPPPGPPGPKHPPPKPPRHPTGGGRLPPPDGEGFQKPPPRHLWW